MPPVRVLKENEWARIVAKAFLDGTTSDLEKDPKTFVDGVRTANDPDKMSLPSTVRLFSLDYSNWSQVDSVGIDLLAIFQGSSHTELQEIINSGTLDKQPVEMPPGEWIDPYGLTKLFKHSGPPTISQKDWMRIYAYVWDQIRWASNATIREHFEEDPARTLQDIDNPHVYNDQIIAALNASSPANLHINYTYQTTPLFTLGTIAPPGTLTDIHNAVGAMGYGHRIRLTC